MNKLKKKPTKYTRKWLLVFKIRENFNKNEQFYYNRTTVYTKQLIRVANSSEMKFKITTAYKATMAVFSRPDRSARVIT